jgi:murein DD-endopeptidase MepM/ murein hydrolase activator NlpD
LKSSIPFKRTLAEAATRTGQYLSHHPRSLTAAVSLALAGFAATAFGLAAAPDVSELLPQQRTVTEIVTPESIPAQLDTLATHTLTLYRSDVTRASDTVDSLLRRLGVADAQAAAFLRSDPVARRLLEGRAGKMTRVLARSTGQLDELVARFASADPALATTHFTRLRVTRGESGFHAALETGTLTTQLRLGSGTVASSLFAATDDANIPDAVASQMAEVFATEIDFHRDLRRGDSFSVLYEALTADGEPINWGGAAGRVMAAEFVNAGERHSAVLFNTESGKGAYFDFDGRSKQHSFLASPMEFSRVTSGFAMRMHPIFNQWKQHKGVDYGAPSGTPVRAVGDGVVEFAGRQNGYGNVVQIKHSQDRATVYAHLSRIDVKQGQHIEQGAHLGAVGATGWATGPHLHFEFKVNGVHQDPMAIAKSSETLTIAPAARAQFAQLAQSFRGQLDVAPTLAASARYSE